MARQGGVALSLNADSTKMVAAIQRANASLANHGKAVRRTQADWRSFTQNSIFMVEDMSSVYGTSGLAGAIRAGSNNLTMMAMAFGPWAMGAAVAASAIAQLTLAFWDMGNEAEDAEEKAKKAIDVYKSNLNKGADAAKERHRWSKKIIDGTRDEQKAARDSMRAKIEEQQAVLDWYKKTADARKSEAEQMRMKASKLREEARNELALGAAGKHRKQQLLEQAEALEEQARQRHKLHEETMEAYDAERKAQKRNQEMLEWADKQAKEFNKQNPVSQDVPLPPGYDENAVAIQAQKEINRLEQESLDNAAKKRREMESINRELKSAVDGSMEFAKAFQGTTETARKQETPREKASREAMERKRERFMQNDRGLFGERREKEAWNIAEEQRWNVDESFRRMALGYEFGDGFEGQQKTAANRERLGSAWDVYNQRQQREKSPEYYKTMESAMQKRAELDKKRQATKEEMETAANTKRSNELLERIADNIGTTSTPIEVVMGGLLS